MPWVLPRPIRVRFPGVRNTFWAMLSALLVAVMPLVGLGLSASAGAQNDPVLNVRLDGLDTEWPEKTVINTDGYYLYLKIFGENLRNLQQHDEVIRIRLDLDDDNGTGSKLARSRGTDLEIDFSPRLERFGDGRDLVAIRQYSDVGPTRRIPPESIDLLALPTHAARYFEVRISRFPAEEHFYPVNGFLSQGEVSGSIEVLSSAGLSLEPPRRTEFSTIVSPRADRPLVVDRPLPAKAQGATRFVVWRIGKARALREQAAASRMLRALNPDVVLIQSWAPRTDAESVASWFNEALPLGEGGAADEPASWRALAPPRDTGSGVVTVSRLPMREAIKAPVWATPERKDADADPLSMSVAMVRVDGAWLAVTNFALAEGGTMDDSADALREAEAQVVNLVNSLVGENLKPAGVVMGGQLNLWGDSDIIRRRLYSRLDGRSALIEAEPWVFGTRSQYTFGMPGQGLVRGVRAGFAYSRGSLEVSEAFVADTDLLSRSVMEQSGLEPGDVRFAEDYPFVVDLRLKP